MKRILLVLLLSGCAVDAKQIAKAEEVCEANGGVRWVESSISGLAAIIKCNNGAKFRKNVTTGGTE